MAGSGFTTHFRHIILGLDPRTKEGFCRRYTADQIEHWLAGEGYPTWQQLVQIKKILLLKDAAKATELDLLEAEYRAVAGIQNPLDGSLNTIEIDLPSGLTAMDVSLAIARLKQRHAVQHITDDSKLRLFGKPEALFQIETTWEEILRHQKPEQRADFETVSMHSKKGMPPTEIEKVKEKIRRAANVSIGDANDGAAFHITGSTVELDKATRAGSEALDLWDFDNAGRNIPIEQVPPIPQPGPASMLRATELGFEIDAKPLPPNEAADAIQRSIHSRLARRVRRLDDVMVRIENSNGDLAAELRDYAALLANDVAEVDIASLWSSGAALAQFVEALDPEHNVGTMTTSLEPGLLAEFRSLIIDHTAFVEGSSVGREMRERVTRYRQADQRPDHLVVKSKPVLEALLDVTGLLADGAKHLIGSLLRATDIIGAVTLPVAVASFETARNSVLSIAMPLYWAAINPEAAADLLKLVGIDQGTLETATQLFATYKPVILAITVNEPTLQIFLEWTAATIERRIRQQIDRR